jgi:hypothetical protein
MRPGRFLMGFGLATAAVLLVLILLALFSPSLVKTDWFQERSLAYISNKFSGQLKWEGFQWTLLPAPRLKLQQVSFERTNQIEAKSGSITVYPRILSLLRGRIDLGRVVVEAPSIRLATLENGQVLNPLKEGMAVLAGLRSAFGADSSLQLQNGRVEVSGGREPAISFKEINGEIEFLNKEERVSLSCLSDWLGEMTVDGVLDPEKRGSQGKVVLQRFVPHRILHAFLPEIRTAIKESLAQLTFQWAVNGAGDITLNAEGTVERLVLAAKGHDVEVAFPRFSGTARVNGSDVSVELSQLLVNRGGGEVSGTLAISKSDPRARVQLVGQRMDVHLVREVTLALFEKDDDVRIVFDVLRGGFVPSVELATQGKDLREMAHLSNLTIRGGLRGGTVYIRDLDLDLRDVSGEANIQGGLLEASNAQARLGSAATGTNGALSFGLGKKDDRFHLDVEVKADVGQFPVYLPRVWKNGVGLHELPLMKDLTGQASGRLVLGEDLKALRAAISVFRFNAAATYQRVPFPIQLSGGSIKLTEEKVDFAHLSCVIGKSEFLDVGGTVRWDEAPSLDIRSGKAEALLDELIPWLQSQPGLSSHLADLRDLRGVFLLNEMALKGPLANPGDWQFKMAGRMRGLSCEIGEVSERVRIREGEFSYWGGASSGRISLSDALLRVSDAALQVTGTIDHDLTSGFAADLSFKGKLGNLAMKMLAKVAGLPREFLPRSPLNILIARFWRGHDGTTRVSGDASLGGEVSVSLECLVTGKRLDINNLAVRDGQSFAQMTLNWQDHTLAIAFKGDLKQLTISKIVPPGLIRDGSLKGDFRAQIRTDRPLESSIVGSLTVDDFSLPLGEQWPIKVSHCAINAEKDRITVESALVSFGDTPFKVTGDVWLVVGQLIVNLDVSTGSVDWSEFARIFGKDGPKRQDLLGSGPTDLPVRGIIRLESESLSYKGRTWVPFKSDLKMMDTGWTVEVKEANLCGISTPAVLQLKSGAPLLKVFPSSKEQSLYQAIQCLLGEHVNVTGKFDLSGHMEGGLKEAPFSKGLSGELAFRARGGRIYRYELLSKIFSFLSLTELLRGKLPDMGKEGFAYNTMHAKAELLDGRLVIKEAIIDGKSMEIGCEGEVDLIRDQLDLRVLVAPLKTVDFIIKHIPGLNYILGGTLISFPVRVSGRLADPTITPLSPSAVGLGLLGIMERTFMLPIKIIEPVLPEKTK